MGTTGRARTVVAVVAALALAVGAAGCGGSDGDEAGPGGVGRSTTSTPSTGDDPAEPGAVAAPGTYSVVRVDRTLVDDRRPTAAHGSQAELPSRTLPTLVLLPSVEPPATPGTVEVQSAGRPAPGPWPLIVFGHGSTRAGVDYLDTLGAWASAGYVVAAPNFPLSTTGAPGGTDFADVPEQTRDVSFVIDQVLAASADPDDPLHGTVDPEAVGVGGQSFGAITAVAVGFNACCADPRIDAVTSFAGTWADLGDGEDLAPVAADRPSLLVHGDADEVLGYDRGQHVEGLLPMPKRFLTLVGGSHDAGYFGGLGDPLDRLVTEATVAFYDRWLKGDDTAAARLQELVATAGPTVATLG